MEVACSPVLYPPYRRSLCCSEVKEHKNIPCVDERRKGYFIEHYFH